MTLCVFVFWGNLTMFPHITICGVLSHLFHTEPSWSHLQLRSGPWPPTSRSSWNPWLRTCRARSSQCWTPSKLRCRTCSAGLWTRSRLSVPVLLTKPFVPKIPSGPTQSSPSQMEWTVWKGLHAATAYSTMDWSQNYNSPGSILMKCVPVLIDIYIQKINSVIPKHNYNLDLSPFASSHNLLCVFFVCARAYGVIPYSSMGYHLSCLWSHFTSSNFVVVFPHVHHLDIFK